MLLSVRAELKEWLRKSANVDVSINRMICWFSAGAASAVATKLINDRFECEIIYCDTGSEHEDNKRFIKDCERWYGKKICIEKSDVYADTWEVFEKTRYLSGVAGARCTVELKKKIRQRIQIPYQDIQVFGFTNEEKQRAKRFEQNNPEAAPIFPLIKENLSKADCFRILKEANIEIPQMYKLGYKNNNCIGCVKGQSGYWNKIRMDFPEVFKRMATMERKLDVALNKRYEKGKRLRVFLDELPKTAGNYKSEPSLSCGVLCEQMSLFLNIEVNNDG